MAHFLHHSLLLSGKSRILHEVYFRAECAPWKLQAARICQVCNLKHNAAISARLWRVLTVLAFDLRPTCGPTDPPPLFSLSSFPLLLLPILFPLLLFSFLSPSSYSLSSPSIPLPPPPPPFLLPPSPRCRPPPLSWQSCSLLMDALQSQAQRGARGQGHADLFWVGSTSLGAVGGGTAREGVQGLGFVREGWRE